MPVLWPSERLPIWLDDEEYKLQQAIRQLHVGYLLKLRTSKKILSLLLIKECVKLQHLAAGIERENFKIGCRRLLVWDYCCDLENRVRVRSRSLEMAPFDRLHTRSYSPSNYGDTCILYCLRDFYTQPVFSVPAGGDPVGILWNVWCW